MLTELTMESAKHPSGARRRALASLAAFALAASMLFLTAGPAQAACSGNVWDITNNFKNVVAGYNASWSVVTHTAGAPCVDVNVKNLDFDEQGFVGRYKSGGNWIAGVAGWVDVDEGNLGVLISSLSGIGIPVAVGAAENSWELRILT